MAGIFNKAKGALKGVTQGAQGVVGGAQGLLGDVANVLPGGTVAQSPTKKLIVQGLGIALIIGVIYLIVAYFTKMYPFAPDDEMTEEEYRMYDNLGPGFGRRDPRDTARAPKVNEGFEIPAPVGNRQMDESLPSAVSVLNDPRFHTVTKTLLSTQNRIGENIQVRHPTTDLRGSVPVFTSGEGTLFNQQLSRSEFSDTLA